MNNDSFSSYVLKGHPQKSVLAKDFFIMIKSNNSSLQSRGNVLKLFFSAAKSTPLNLVLAVLVLGVVNERQNGIGQVESTGDNAERSHGQTSRSF